MVVALTMLEDELFGDAGNRLLAEMVRMLVGAARYTPARAGAPKRIAFNVRWRLGFRGCRRGLWLGRRCRRGRCNR
jgi:hypothetical protein